MEVSTIIENINSWASARALKDERLFKQLFGSVVGFSFTAGYGNEKTDGLYYHAYAGIKDGNLTFYILRSDYDIAKYDETKIIHTTMISLTGTQPILPEEATARIDMWQKNHTTWLGVQTGSEDGIYQVFVIPADDIGAGVVSAFFALNLNPDSDPDAKEDFGEQYPVADLILYMAPVAGAPIAPYDLVRPVPPFKPRPGTPREAFHLLPQ